MATPLSPPPKTSVADVHAAVRGFMDRQGLGPQELRADGRLSLAIDGRYRVHLHPAAGGRIVLSAQVLDLAGRYGTRDTDAALEHLMHLAAGLMQQYASSLSLDAARQSLLLQQTLGPDTDVAGVENALAEFVNALAFWSRACAAQLHA